MLFDSGRFLLFRDDDIMLLHLFCCFFITYFVSSRFQTLVFFTQIYSVLPIILAIAVLLIVSGWKQEVNNKNRLIFILVGFFYNRHHFLITRIKDSRVSGSIQEAEILTQKI